jgi:hypothetical protein
MAMHVQPMHEWNEANEFGPEFADVFKRRGQVRGEFVGRHGRRTQAIHTAFTPSIGSP